MLLKIILGAVVGVCVAVGAVGGAVYFGVVSLPFPLRAAEPEKSARLYPPDVVAYSWMSLSPGIGQLRDIGDTLSRLEDLPEFERLRDDAADGFEDNFGLDFEDDVMPWLGASASLALFDIDEDPVETAGTVEIRDRAAAEDALEKRLDFVEDARGADFARDFDGDFKVWADENAREFYALSDDLMIFANSRSALRAVIRRAGGETERTLAASDRFQQARSAMPSRRFSSAYLDVDELMDTLWAGELGFDDAAAYGDCVGEFFPTPDWLAGSAGWVERGVVFDFVAPSSDSFDMPPAPPLADAAAWLPSDTMGFFALSFDPVLDNWRAALADYAIEDLAGCFPEAYEYADMMGVDVSGDFSDLLDEALDALDTFMGMDVESDLLDNLGGQMAAAVGGFDFGEVSDNPTQAPVHAAAALSHREGAGGDLQDLIDDLAEDAYRDYGLQFQEADVGAERPAMIYPIEGTRYAPGAVVSGGFLTIATTRRALRDVADVQAGRESALSSDPEYARALSHLPADRSWLLYIDLRRLADGIDRADANMTRDQMEALETVAGAVAISATESDGFDRTTMVVTLFGQR